MLCRARDIVKVGFVNDLGNGEARDVRHFVSLSVKAVVSLSGNKSCHGAENPSQPVTSKRPLSRLKRAGPAAEHVCTGYSVQTSGGFYRAFRLYRAPV